MPAPKRKFRELILYVAKESQGDPRCGSTKLNKILFYADFLAFRKLGRSISEQHYVKRELGPVPKQILPALRELEKAGQSAWAERDYYGHPLRKLIALREPDLSLFSAAEVDLVRNVIAELWELNGSEVSDLSHRFVGWQAAELGEEIPYGTVLVDGPRPLTDEENEWAQEVIREYREQQTA